MTRDERMHRQQAVRDARHTNMLEGTVSTPATRADEDAYQRGEIDLAQLSERVRARYGIQ